MSRTRAFYPRVFPFLVSLSIEVQISARGSVFITVRSLSPAPVPLFPFSANVPFLLQSCPTVSENDLERGVLLGLRPRLPTSVHFQFRSLLPSYIFSSLFFFRDSE